MFDNQLLALFGQIINMPQMTFYELAMVNGKNQDETKRDIGNLNYALNRANFPIIQIEKEKYIVPEEVQERTDEIIQFFRNVQVYLDEEERRYILYLYTFIRQNAVSNFHFQDLLQVSKNTALSDVKKLRKDLHDFDLEFRYTRAEGYFIHGAEEDKRRAALRYIIQLLQEPIGEWALMYIFSSWNKEQERESLAKKVKTLAPHYDVSFVDSRLREAICLMDFIRIRQMASFQFESVERQRDIRRIAGSPVYRMCLKVLEKYFSPQRLRTEALFFSILLMGMVEGNSYEKPDKLLMQITHQVVQKMEALALIEFDAREDLIKTLYTHLVPAYYRLIFDVQDQNPMTGQIQSENKELFIIVKNALQPLSDLVGEDLNDDEVAYFVIHFGGQIQKQLRKKEQYKAMIVCPNGVSSSLILKSELEQLFPEFYWLQEHSKGDFDGISEEEYDLVFSTVFIHTEKPLYIVKPVMNQRNKSNLVRRVSKDFLLERNAMLDVDELLTIIHKYADVKNEKKLIEALSRKSLNMYKEERKYLPMLEDLLTEDYIQIYDNQESELSWKEAIQLSSQPLLENRNIEERYIQAIFNKLAEFGTFIDLGQGVAIPHARPDEGVLELGMSLLKLAKPVNLLGDEAHPIDLFITLAAIDNETHLKALSQLTQILSDSAKLKILKEATTKKEVITVLKNREETIENA